MEEYKVTVTLAPDGNGASDSPKSDDAAKLPLTMAKLETLTERRSNVGVEVTWKQPSNYHQLSSAMSCRQIMSDIRYLRTPNRVTVYQLEVFIVSAFLSSAQGERVKTPPNCLNWCGLKVCRA